MGNSKAKLRNQNKKALEVNKKKKGDEQEEKDVEENQLLLAEWWQRLQVQPYPEVRARTHAVI